MTRRIVLVALFSAVVFLLASGIALAADFIWPVEGKILREFGKDEFGNHGGIDIEASQGTSVKAAVSGVITNVGSYKEGSPYPFDNTLTVKYGEEGYHATYWQIRPFVSEGMSVEKGQEIGEVIKSADGDTPVGHLHFGVVQKNESRRTYYNPLDFLPVLISESVQELAQEPAASQLVSDDAGAQLTLNEQPSPVSASAVADATTTPSTASSEPPPIVQPLPQAEPMSLSGTISVTPSQSQGTTATVSPSTIGAVAATEESSQPSPAASLPSQGKVLVTQVVQPVEAVVVPSPTAELVPTLSPAPVSEAEAALDPPTPANRGTLTALKDRQIEALSPAPANPHGSLGQDSAKYRAQPMRRFESQQSTIAISPDSAVITKCFLYLLLIVGSLVSTRAYSLHPGLTART